MATVNQVYEALYRLRVDDQASAGLQAATSIIEKRTAAIAAGDVVEAQSAQAGARILRSYDDRGKALAALARAEKDLATAQAAAAQDAATEGGKQDNYARAIANVSVKVDEARTKLQALDAASQGNTTAINAAGSAADTASARLQKMATEADRATRFLNTFKDANAAQLPAGVYEHATSAVAAYGTEIDRLRAKYDPLYAASKRYSDQIEEISAAEKVNALSQAQASAAIDRLTAAYAKANAVNDGSAERKAETDAYAKSLDDLRAKYDPLFAASKRYSDQYAEIEAAQKTGAITAEQAASAQDRLTAAYAKANAVDDGSGQRQAETETQARALDNLKAKYDPLFAVEKRHVDELAEIAKLTEANAISNEMATAAIAQSTAVYDKSVKGLKDFTEVSRGASFAARNMGMQVFQGFQTLALGQGVFQTILQQGPQIVDVMSASGQSVKSLGGAFYGMFQAAGGFVTLISVSVVGALGALAIAGNSALGKMAELRTALRGSQDDYVNLAKTVQDAAKSVAASSMLSTSEASKAASIIAGSKYFSGTSDDIKRLIRDAADLGAVLGGDATLGAQKLSAGLTDTYKTAQDLASGPNGLRTLDANTLHMIDTLQTAGDRSGAFAVLLKAVESAAKGAADDVSPLASAWNELANAFSNGTSKGKSFGEMLAGGFAEFIRTTAQEVRALKEVMNSLIEVFEKAKGYAASGWEKLKSYMPSDDAFKQAGNELQRQFGGVDQSPTVSNQAQLTSSATKEAFVTNWLDAARSAGQQLGVSPNVILGHWAVETNYGKSLYDNNPGNIQAGSNYTGNTTVRGDTHADGSAYQTQFRAYASPQDFAADYVKLLQNPRYAAARNTNDDPMAFGGGLRRGGYMEDTAAPGKIAAAANSLSGITGGVSEGMINNAKALNDEYGKLAEGTRALEAIKLDARLADIDKQMQGVDTSTTEGAQKYAVLKQRQEEVNAAIYKNVDAQTEAQRAAESSLRANAGETEGLRGLNAELEKAKQLALTTGSPFGSAQEQQATINYLAQQSQAYDKLTYSMGEAQNNSAQMAQAYDKGNQAALTASASQRALTEAMKLFPNSAEEQGAAVRTLTQTYLDMDRAAGEAQIAQQNLTSRNNLEYIAAETSTIGMNEDARVKLLATMKAEAEMHAKFGDILPKEAQDYISLASATVEAQANMQQMQNSFNDFQNIGVNAFQQVGAAITDALVNGNKQALSFGNIFKGVLSSIVQQIVQMGVINPVLNNVFGGTRSTLSSALTAYQSGGMGGGVADASFDGAGYQGATESSFDSGGYSGSYVQVPAAANDNSSTLGSAQSLLGGAGSVYNIGTLVTNTSSVGATAVTGAVDAFSGAGVELVGSSSLVAEGASLGVETAGMAPGTVGALTSATSAISTALPYIGAGIGAITSFAKGDYMGGAGTLVGAAIGTAILPGVGTALGAVLGNVVGGLFGNKHPEHPFGTVGVEVQDGQLAVGTVASQKMDISGALQDVKDYTKQVNTYLASAHLVIDNPNGRIGGVGEGVTGWEQVKNVRDLFQTLSFRPDDTVDKSTNFYKAEAGSLSGTKFMTPEELQGELVKVAQFSDGLDAFGVHLQSVGQHLQDIRIESVDGLAENVAALNGEGKPSDTYNFRTALQHDLPGQSFANTDAFWAEVNKVNQFVNGTLPSLLHPVFQTTSDLMKQISDLNKTYADAAAQAASYGLATQDLTKAQADAIATLQAPALKELALSNLGIAKRGAAARGEDTSQYDLQGFDLQADQQREALKKQYTDIYGSLIPVQQQYGDAAKTLDQTLAAERLKLLRGSNGEMLASDQDLAAARAKLVQQERAAWDSNFSVMDKFNSIRARASAVAGDQKGADLSNFDSAAEKEQMDYARQLVDNYGDAFYKSTDYNNRMLELTNVQEQERLAIIKKYGEQGVQATQDSANAMAAAQQKVGTLVDSLKDYANSLKVGDQSPLSAMDQYALAKSQFQAVQGAAAAGDYNSAAKLQSYSQTFLQASRTLNGSGAGYANDYNSVLTALQGVADAGQDKLTASAMAEATQAQTVALSTKFDELKAELVALRREYQQQARAA